MTYTTALSNLGELSELNAVSAILAGGLSQDIEAVLGVPLEVAQALAEAREQMANLPEVIASLNKSLESYYTVSTALYRMIELADLALGADMSDEARRPLNDEFVSLAKVVAADAGRQYYAGPSLNLLSQAQAASTARIIRYMEPVIENTGREISAQKELIHEVVAETLSFLRVVTDCYPDSEGVGALRALIDTVNKQGGRLNLTSAPANLH